MIIQTLKLLNMLMSGYQMSASELDDLLLNKTPEDLYLEYKHGNELVDHKKGATTIRQYISGFANSAGGVLIIGVDEANWKITGGNAPGGSSLSEWATRCLTPIAGYFSPPPRFQTVDHPNGKVLIIATERSPTLVPCQDKDGPAFYFRLHDQTLNNKTIKAPEYLISDIVLGRRQKPELRVFRIDITDTFKEYDQEKNCLDMYFSLKVSLENQGFYWAEDTRLGIIGFHKRENDSAILGEHLLSYIELQPNNGRKYSGEIGIVHHRANVGGLEPFALKHLNLGWQFKVPLHTNNYWHEYTWKATIYFFAKSITPIWYQLNLRINSELVKLFQDQNQPSFGAEFFSFEQVPIIRPHVSWDGI